MALNIDSSFDRQYRRTNYFHWLRYVARIAGTGLLLVVLLTTSLPAYSVFTHEQLIDLAWKDGLRAALLKRFPNTSDEQLKSAHAYAYGGSAIQDMGYYPFSNQFFSNLTHYVRSGDFIMALLHDARDPDEYAFALGALSHYVGDNIGHHDAINLSTPIAFPKLEKKYGPVVTYDEDPHAHVRTEFAFDIDQLGKHRLAPSAYLRFVGLRVPVRLLTQAFDETYALQLESVIGRDRPSFRTYRWSVRSFLPHIAYAESQLHRQQFPPDVDNNEFQLYLEHLEQADFQTVWNQYRRGPSFETHVLAFLIRIVPKIGVISDLAIKLPTPHTQELYVDSVNRALAVYEDWLKKLSAAGTEIPEIPNRDLDTGEKTKPGAYALTDTTYAQLLGQLTRKPNAAIPSGLKEDVLEYYGDPNAPIATKKNPKAWARLQQEVSVIRQMAVLPSQS